MTFVVEITEPAHADVQVTYNWIAERSPGGALRWYEAYQLALDSLRHDADKNALAPESKSFPDEVRQVLFKTKRGRRYRILYSVLNGKVVVLHVRGPGQDLVRP